MNKVIQVLVLTLIISFTAKAADGVINVQSAFSVNETVDRMESLLQEKGMTIFNRISHSDGASKVGIELRDTQLLIFGNPKVGSPLMHCQQTVAIDLPQKALIWEDTNADVWVSYNDPQYLVERHDITGCEEVIAKIEKALAGITKAVTTQ